MGEIGIDSPACNLSVVFKEQVALDNLGSSGARRANRYSGTVGSLHPELAPRRVEVRSLGRVRVLRPGLGVGEARESRDQPGCSVTLMFCLLLGGRDALAQVACLSMEVAPAAGRHELPPAPALPLLTGGGAGAHPHALQTTLS